MFNREVVYEYSYKNSKQAAKRYHNDDFVSDSSIEFSLAGQTTCIINKVRLPKVHCLATIRFKIRLRAKN